MVSKVDKMQPSSIYGLAIEHYAEMGYTQREADILIREKDRLSSLLTLKTKYKNVISRRVTPNDTAELLHAIGVLIVQNENT